MADQDSSDFERSAGGMDYDDDIGERARELGSKLAEGPDVLFEEIEELLPEMWRDQVVRFPIGAVVLGVAAGVFLGMKKGDELLTAGSAMVTAAVAANVRSVLGQLGRNE